jgi:hypothetical protein
LGRLRRQLEHRRQHRPFRLLVLGPELGLVVQQLVEELVPVRPLVGTGWLLDHRLVVNQYCRLIHPCYVPFYLLI